jgi:hypothetical protein
MAVVQVTEKWDREVSFTVENNFARTYKRTWFVDTDTVTDGQIQVLSALPVKPGQYFDLGNGVDVDGGAFLLGLSARCSNECPCHWEVTASYGPWVTVPREENPLDQAPEVTFSYGKYQKIADEDALGNAVLNAAGDQFDPPVMRDDSRPTIRVVRNEQDFDTDLAEAMKDAVNHDVFKLMRDSKGNLKQYDPGKVKVEDIQGTPRWHPACKAYYQVSYEFHVDPDGWVKQILNAGMRQLVSGALAPCQLKGIPATSPVPLNDDGTQRSPDEEPLYVDVQLYSTMPFSNFNFVS